MYLNLDGIFEIWIPAKIPKSRTKYCRNWLVLLATAAIGVGVMVYTKGKVKAQAAAPLAPAKVA